MAKPFAEVYSMLAAGDRIRNAADGELYPNIEVWFVSNDVEREAIANTLMVEFNNGKIAIRPIDLQIAWKLRLPNGREAPPGRISRTHFSCI